jgi:glutamyl-tRNA reductase
MSIFCFGLSHQTASVDVQERFAIPESALPEALARLKTMPGPTEGLIVSTCNRTEFYVTGEFRDSSAPVFFETFYRDFRAGDGTHLFRLWANHCVRHLFQVTSGLESMVVGETEIFGQVKRAYEFATGAKATGKLLNRLFQKSFQVGKQVRSSTAITRGSVSLGSVAVDLAEKIFGDLDGCKIMILGAGETSEKTAKAFRTRGAGQIFVSNRSFKRAQALVTITGGRAIHFEDWEKEFRDLDILVSSTAAPHAIITSEMVAPFLRARRHRPLFIIDLAMPRDIDPAVRKLDGVYLYDLDSLQSTAGRTLAVRKQESEKCHQLIQYHVQDFQLWIEHAQSPNSPSIVVELPGLLAFPDLDIAGLVFTGACGYSHSSSFQGMDAPRAAAKREYHSSRLREMESALAQARNRSGRVVPSTG